MTQPIEHAVRTWEHEAIHLWFSLTYANYLVLPRSILQSMPDEWQERFVACLAELEATPFDWEPPHAYSVSARDADGRYCADTAPHYNRGRARVPLREESA